MIHNALDEVMLLETSLELIDEGQYASSVLDSCEIFMEVYRGKQPELIKAENLLDEICEEIINNTQYNKALSFSNDERVKKVERYLASVFEARKFDLFIYDDIITNTMFGVNGFTIPQALSSFNADKDGLSKELSMYVSVSQRLVSKLKLTGGELLAIILHEIGHNVRKDWLRSISEIINIAFNPTILLTLFGLQQQMLISGPKEMEARNPQAFRDTTKVVNTVVNFIKSSLRYPMMLNTISKLLKDPTLLLTVFNPVTYMTGYAEEKYADSLPTSFGYGYEMSMVAIKFDNFAKSGIFIKPSPMSIVEDFIVRTFRVLMSPLDVHPQEAVRLVSQIKNMKKHLKDPSITPQQRKELERSLGLIEEYMDNVYKNPKHAKNMAAPLTYIWNMITLGVKGFVDPRELLNLLRIEE